MKLLIASDLHGSVSCCEKLIAAYSRERADKLLLLGDLLYHGPRNDIPGEYDTKRVVLLLNGFSENLLCVRGNCDAEVDQMALSFPMSAEYAALFIDGRVMYMQHGHREAVSPRAGEIVLRGHTHVPAHETRAGALHLNPGSVSIPKQGSVNSYMTYENGVFLWKTADGDAYDEYRA